MFLKMFENTCHRARKITKQCMSHAITYPWQCDSCCLQHLLGDWQPNFSQDFTWEWQAHLQTLVLFQYCKNQWVANPHFRHYLDSIVYDHYTSLTSTPQGTVPATPILTTAYIHIALPLGILPGTTPPNPPL